MLILEDTLNLLNQKASQFRDNSTKLTESDTIRVLILPLLKALGWDLDDLHEVRSEYRHASSDNPVDYAFFIDKKPCLFLEAKAFGISLDDRKYISQAVNYANTAGVKWCILSNGKDWRVYNTHAEVDVEKKLFFSFSIQNLLDVDYSKIKLLSKESIFLKTIDTFWKDFNIDEKIKLILQNLPLDEAFINLISTKINISDKKEISNALKRLYNFGDKDNEEDSSQENSKLFVTINNDSITGSTVAELYQNSVQRLINLKLIKDETLPFHTGRKRYLISKTPFHPNNIPFYNPKKVCEYYLECNKSRNSAPTDMQKFIDFLLLTTEVDK